MNHVDIHVPSRLIGPHWATQAAQARREAGRDAGKGEIEIGEYQYTESDGMACTKNYKNALKMAILTSSTQIWCFSITNAKIFKTIFITELKMYLSPHVDG